MSTVKKETIELKHLYSGILAGADNIVLNCDELNHANGFPVPDMDTGNNLSFLMQKVLKDIKPQQSIKGIMETVSNAAILGARGNSGAIFSQFFHGFEKVSPNAEYLQKEDLVSCFCSAYEYAYKAIQEPVEGTIITAIRSFAESLKSKAAENINIAELLEYAYSNLKNTEAETRYHLSAQRALGKEDAGAKAFLFFMEGFVQMIIDRVSGYISTSVEAVDRPRYVEDILHNLQDVPNNRFCTEVLLKKNKPKDFDQIKSILQNQGDSIVISENSTFMRVHIHVNVPSEVVRLLSGFGEIMEVKADDMKMQTLLAKENEYETAFITDSIADLPEDWPDFVYQMPLNLLVDNVSYQDKRTVYSQLLEKGKATSAQPSVEEIKKFLDPIAKRYKQVIILSVSSKMSGVYQRFVQGAKDYEGKVWVIDSKLNSVAQGLVARRTIQAIEEKTPLAEILESINNWIPVTKIYVSLPNLNGMISSGRLNEKIGIFLQKLGFLPLITINKKGEGTITGAAFSKAGNEKMLLKQIEKTKNNIAEYAIVHADDEKRALKIANQVEEILGMPPVYVDHISSIVKIFSGKGSVAIGYIEKE